MNHFKKSAFTLIEVLLVVALISLLISLLLPGLSRSKHAAHTAVCASNLSQIYKATISYSTYNRTLLPGARAWVGGSWWDVNGPSNGTLYADMGKNNQAYICPVFPQTKPWWTTSYGGQDYTTKTTVGFTYSLNEYAGNGWQGQYGVRITSVEEPDQLYLYGDENPWMVPGYSNHPINNGAMGVGKYELPSDIVDAIGSFHYPSNGNLNDGFSNVLFFDGHVGLVHITKTKEVVTPRRYKF